MKKGYITVFFALIFMVLLSFILSVFEGIRMNAYRLKAECAYSVAANSVLGEYHKELLEMYDLFYVDTAYNTGAPDYHYVEARLWKYVENNIGIPPELVEVDRILLATDNQGISYRKQISEYMKDRVGVSYLEELWQLSQTVSKEGLLDSDLNVQNSFDKKWQEALNRKEEIPEKTWDKVEKLSSIEKVCDKGTTVILSQVIKDDSSISGKKVNITDCVSKRECIKGTGSEKVLDITDKLYFIGYVFEKFSYYSKERDDKLLDYEIEYLIGNSGSDYENLSQVAEKLFAVRECMNLMYLLSDSDRMMAIKELSQALSTAVVCPELTPVFTILLVGFWSYAESVKDVEILFEGGRVPLFKTDESWNTDLDNGFGFSITSKQSDEERVGMDYKQYLEMFLLCSADEKITLRSMDLIEMNIREIAGNEYFRMDGLAEDFLVNIVFEIPQFGSYQIVRRFGYCI